MVVWLSPGDIFMCFSVCWQKSMQHLSEKDPSFLFPQVVQKHYVGEMGK